MSDQLAHHGGMTPPDFDPEIARLNALIALRSWTRRREPGRRAGLVAEAWRAGERDVRELARIADVSRQTVRDDLRSQGIDPRDDQAESVPVETVEAHLVVDPSDVPIVRDLASARGVVVKEYSERGIEPVSTTTLALVGTAAAISGLRQALERRKGGQMIDLRPGAEKLAYRTTDLEYGIVVIIAGDGKVTVKINKPDDVFEKVISALPKLLPGGTTKQQAARVIEETLGSDAEVEAADDDTGDPGS